MTDNQQKSEARAVERRRQRVAGAFHLASALVRTYNESDPDVTMIAWHAVRLADAVLERLEETEER